MPTAYPRLELHRLPGPGLPIQGFLIRGPRRKPDQKSAKHLRIIEHLRGPLGASGDPRGPPKSPRTPPKTSENLRKPSPIQEIRADVRKIMFMAFFLFRQGPAGDRGEAESRSDAGGAGVSRRAAAERRESSHRGAAIVLGWPSRCPQAGRGELADASRGMAPAPPRSSRREKITTGGFRPFPALRGPSTCPRAFKNDPGRKTGPGGGLRTPGGGRCDRNRDVGSLGAASSAHPGPASGALAPACPDIWCHISQPSVVG